MTGFSPERNGPLFTKGQPFNKPLKSCGVVGWGMNLDCRDNTVPTLKHTSFIKNTLR